MHTEEKPLRLGISACLMGEKVRYDGGHKRDLWILNDLGRFADYLMVCPEVESGFSTPRPGFQLEGRSEAPRMVITTTGEDVTPIVTKWAKARCRELAQEQLDGYILKRKSPSCGMERVRLYPGNNAPPTKKASGLFAMELKKQFPLLPMEEDGRLHDPVLRENFVERIFVMRRWRALGRGRGALVDFHTRHKLLIMSHSVRAYRELGQLVASLGQRPLDAIRTAYIEKLMSALHLTATRKKHMNVLQHIAGYFKKDLAGNDRQQLAALLASYRNEQVPLIVPITLLNFFAQKFQQSYLSEQTYLHPHPVELKLRNIL